jgi:formamidopyrimidine-DNA glycosylase
MTGALVWAPHGEKRHSHDRVVLVLERGELRFRDQRKLQGIWLAREDDEADRILGRQGPDAYGLSRSQLEEVLVGRRGGLKALLMDQRVVAGLGNLLTDEILWRARLHPSRRVEGLDQGQLGRLHRVLGSVLEASVKAGRVPPRPSWLTGVRDDEAPACPRCGTGLHRSRAGGRRSWWCPSCQPAPG